jgi:hypothetical protein
MSTPRVCVPPDLGDQQNALEVFALAKPPEVRKGNYQLRRLFYFCFS